MALLFQYKLITQILQPTPGGLDPFYTGRDICSGPGPAQNNACTTGSEHSKKAILLEKIQELNADTKATSSLQAEYWSQAFIDAIVDTDSFRSHLDQACKSQDGNGDYVTISCSGHSDCPNGCKCSSTSCTGGGPFSASNDLGDKLDMVYRLIAINEARGVNRDFFSVTLGGFDTHFELLLGLSGKFDVVNPAINGFRENLKASVISDGTLWDQVTLVMSSEFGRTVSPNSSAGTGKNLLSFCCLCCSRNNYYSQYLRISDHGWGGNSYMMGGKVKGKHILGSHPKNYNPADEYNTG